MLIAEVVAAVVVTTWVLALGFAVTTKDADQRAQRLHAKHARS